MSDNDLIKQLKVATHITYISSYITKEDIKVTQKQIDKLVNQKLIKESNFPGYYIQNI